MPLSTPDKDPCVDGLCAYTAVWLEMGHHKLYSTKMLPLSQFLFTQVLLKFDTVDS